VGQEGQAGLRQSSPTCPPTSWDDFERAVTPRTKVVAVGAASNMLGTISDVARAARLAHAVGAICFVDAVHYAAHHLVDVRALECDLLACSAYKFCGPHIGVLYGRHDLLQSVTTAALMTRTRSRKPRLGSSLPRRPVTGRYVGRGGDNRRGA